MTYAPPQGRLTLQPGQIVPTRDQSGATTLFYTPATGNLVPLTTDGSAILMHALPGDLSCALTPRQAADSLVDAFIWLNGRNPELVLGPAWSNATPGSGDRGTGAGSAQISRQAGGFYFNAVQFAAFNGGEARTLPAGQGLYVGTLHIDHHAGQVSCLWSYGQNRKWGIWNAFNRLPVTLQVGDTTKSWVYNARATRASNNKPPAYQPNAFNVASGIEANGLVTLCGLAEEVIDIEFHQQINAASPAGGTQSSQNGIGINSTTVATGILGEATFSGSGSLNCFVIAVARASLMPVVGLNNIVCLEQTYETSSVSTFWGGTTNMVMRTKWRG